MKNEEKFRRSLLALMVEHNADAADVMAALREIVLAGGEYLCDQPGGRRAHPD